MKRRELILLLGGAMTASHALRAQQKAMPVIGVLGNTSPGPAAPFLAAFHQGLKDTGYVEGQNVSVEYHWAEGRYDRFPAFATDLVGRKVDVIVTFAVASALAAKSATSTIPIVFTTGGDGRAITGPSSLLRTAPPLRPASVLWLSRGPPA